MNWELAAGMDGGEQHPYKQHQASARTKVLEVPCLRPHEQQL